MPPLCITSGPTKLNNWASEGAVPERVIVSCTDAPTAMGVCVIVTLVIQVGKFWLATVNDPIGRLPVLVTVRVPVILTGLPTAKLVAPKSTLADKVKL